MFVAACPSWIFVCLFVFRICFSKGICMYVNTNVFPFNKLIQMSAPEIDFPHNNVLYLLFL